MNRRAALLFTLALGLLAAPPVTKDPRAVASGPVSATRAVPTGVNPSKR